MSREAQLSAEITAVYQPAITGIEAVEKALNKLTKVPIGVHLRLADFSKVEGQLDKVVQSARSLQRASTAINVQANTTDAKRKLASCREFWRK